MVSQDFRDGAEMVGNAAGAKLEDVGNKINDLKNEFSGYASQQANINEALINKADEHEERMQQLEENRYFVRSSRRGIEDLDPIQQDRMIGWFQKLVKEFNERGLTVTRNQQKFLSNMLQFLGAMDSIGEVQDLNMLADFGDSELHEVIYKIFLIFIYLYDNSFNAMDKLQDITSLFKLSEQNKNDIKRLLEEERIPLLGIEGLISIYDSSRPLNSFTPQSLYANYREIHTHPLLLKTVSEETLMLYIQGLALLAEGKNFSEKQYCYIKSLANVLQCADSLNSLEQLCINPQKFPMKKWIDALNNENLKYSWLLDGCMVLCQQDEISIDTINLKFLEEAAKSLYLLNCKEFLEASAILCLSENSQDLYEALCQISHETQGWEHILEYRVIGLHGAFDDIQKELQKFSMDLMQFHFESVSLVSTSITENGSSEYKKLKEFQKKVELFIENNSDVIYEGNSIIRSFGLEGIPCSNEINVPEFDTSGLNEDWYDDFTKALDTITNTVENYQNAADLIDEQLDLITEGKYHVSILELKKNEKAEREKKIKEEIEAKKSAPVSSEDGTYKVSVDWEEIPDTPFSLDDVIEIGSAGKNWFVVADKPYYLDKNRKWYEFKNFPLSYINKVFQVNGLIFISSYEGTWYSSDCNKWEKINLPTEDDVQQVIYFKGKYVLFTNHQQTYQYVEKGFIFDSEKKGYYDSLEAWQSSNPSKEWTKWNEACFTSEGMSLRSNIACSDNIIIAGFAYDCSYQSNKKKTSDGSLVAYFNGMKWKEATWPYDLTFTPTGTFSFFKNHGIYFGFGNVLTSEEGYEWQEVEFDSYYTNPCDICGTTFLTKPQSDGISIVSMDGRAMSLVALSEAGDWRAFGFGNGYLLGVYRKNQHKSSLLIGKLNAVNIQKEFAKSDETLHKDQSSSSKGFLLNIKNFFSRGKNS